MQQVKIKKLHPNAVIPTYAKEGDAGMDLVATKIIEQSPDKIKFGTDLAIEIPVGFVGLIFPRSSISKKDLVLNNSVGVIDSGYRGEIQIAFVTTDPCPMMYGITEKIAQLIIMPYPQIEFQEVDELSTTERGAGGFGSTGN